MKKKDKIDFLNFLIMRYDTLKSGLLSRSAIVLTIITVILGANLFVLERTLNQSTLSIIDILALAFAIISVICLAFSSYIIVNSIINVKIKSRDFIGEDPPLRLFYHHRETTTFFTVYENIELEVDSMTEDKVIDWGVGELWSLYKGFDRRYKKLSQSVFFLSLAIPPALLSIIIFLFLK